MENIKYQVFFKITKKLRNDLIKVTMENLSEKLFEEADEKLFISKKQRTHSDNMCKDNLKKKLGVIDVDDHKITFTSMGNLII